MQDGILFDNILIASNEEVAESYRLKTWKPKFDVEKERQKAQEGPGFLSHVFSILQKNVFELMYKVADISFLSSYRVKIVDFIKKTEEQSNMIMSIIASIVVIVLTVIIRLVFGFGSQKSEVNASGTNKRMSTKVESS